MSGTPPPAPPPPPPPAFSTPIAMLPMGKAVANPAMPSAEDDPMVRDMLRQMNETDPMPAPAVAQPSVAMPLQPQNYANPVRALQPVAQVPDWWNANLARVAAIAAVLAAVVFYPGTLEALWTRFPQFQVLETYNAIVRPLLLAVLFYAVIWKLEL